MKTLNQKQYQSVCNYYEQIKDTGIDFDLSHLTIIQFGDLELRFTSDFDKFGIIELYDIWFEQDGEKYLIPSMIRKPIIQLISRLGKPLEKIDLSGSPIELLEKYGTPLPIKK